VECLGGGVANFYRESEIEVTDEAVKTASEIYPLEQIENLKVEKRFWWRGSAFVLFIAAFLWLPIGFVIPHAFAVALEVEPGHRIGRASVFAALIPCGLLLAQCARLIWAKKYHITFNWHFTGLSGFAFVELADADEIEPLEEIGSAIQDAQEALKKSS
jgi:hypothetical protein